MTRKEQEKKEMTARDDKVIKSGHTPGDISLRRIHLVASIFEGWRNRENLCCVGKQCFILMFLASAASTNTVFLSQVYFRKQIVFGILCFLTGTGICVRATALVSLSSESRTYVEGMYCIFSARVLLLLDTVQHVSCADLETDWNKM